MIVRRGWPDGRSPNAAMAAIFCLSTSASRLLPRASALTASEAASDAAVRAIAMHGWQRDTAEIVLRLWLGPVCEAGARHELELTLLHRFLERAKSCLLSDIQNLIEGVVSFLDVGG